MSVVYFISCGPGIKIGTSTNVKSRFSSLQTSSMDELLLLGTVPGDVEVERDIHARLGQYRKRGEWFLDCAEVRAAIIEMCGRDVFEIVEEPPQPSPLIPFSEKLAEIFAETKTRYCEFSNFCMRGSEFDKAAPIWRLHVTKRYLIMAAIAYAGRAIEREKDALVLSHDDFKIVGRAVASAELCESHVEIILGDDVWFLEGWEMQPRSNPLFETDGGKTRWATREEAAAGGWVSPANSFEMQIAPWFAEELRAA